MLGTVLLTLLALLLSYALFNLYRRRQRRALNKTKLLVEDYKRDVVYLGQFPVGHSIRSISPFCLKLESWLRLHKIPYENVYTLQFGPKGQMPYIELNGKKLGDSAIIIDELSSHFGIKSDEEKAKSAAAHAFTVMMDNHTCMAGFYWRYGLNMKEFVAKLDLAKSFDSEKIVGSWARFQPYLTRIKIYFHGLGRHEAHEIEDFSFKDLKALNDYLGEKPFLCGSSPGTLDCAAFGHLVQFVYMPLDFPQKQYIRRECPNLVDYVNRVRDEIWPDWESMCDLRCMEGKRAK